MCAVPQLSADVASLLPADDKSVHRTSDDKSVYRLSDDRQAAKAVAKPQITEVWLLLEYCNKGTLRVSMVLMFVFACSCRYSALGLS